MIVANPETGEVLRVPAGENAFFRADTWHHVFAHGDEPLRVLEFLSPPPSAGTTGAYARSKEYLAESRYTDDSLLGRIPGAVAARKTLTWVRPEDIVHRLEGGALVGVLGSTEHLTVASLSLPVSKSAPAHSHGGDEIVFVRDRGVERSGVARRPHVGLRAHTRTMLRTSRRGRSTSTATTARRRSRPSSGSHRPTCRKHPTCSHDRRGRRRRRRDEDRRLHRRPSHGRRGCAGEDPDDPWTGGPGRARRLRRARDQACREPALSSIGVGVCEFVDRSGQITSAFTLDWVGIDVVAPSRLCAPTTVGSDVRAAALAEARFGAARGVSDPWLYVTVGNGNLVFARPRGPPVRRHAWKRDRRRRTTDGADSRADSDWRGQPVALGPRTSWTTRHLPESSPPGPRPWEQRSRCWRTLSIRR